MKGLLPRGQDLLYVTSGGGTTTLDKGSGSRVTREEEAETKGTDRHSPYRTPSPL